MAYLEILIAAIAAFALGALWYTILFGKMWQAETGMTDEQAQSNVAMTHGLSFVMMAILAYAINYVINLHTIEEQTFVHGVLHGAMAGSLYALPAMAIQYLYQKRSFKLYLIDALYVLAFMALEGGILSALKL